MLNRLERIQPYRAASCNVLCAGDSLLLECSPHLNVDTDGLASQLRFFDSDQVVNIVYPLAPLN